LENQNGAKTTQGTFLCCRGYDSALGILLIFIVLGAYQLHRAETGRSNCLPHALRHFIASRELQAAKRAQYENVRLRGYLKVASLDGNDFPEAWSYLCNFYSMNYEWAAARVSCERTGASNKNDRKVSNCVGAGCP
jgi:hypothetical protein